MEKQGLVLIAKRKPGGVLGEKWEFPGGKVEPGETPQKALTRELLEEFEIRVTIGKCLASHSFTNRDKEYQLLAYEAFHLSGDFVLHEHSEIKWVNPKEIGLYDLASSDKGLLSKLNL